VAHAWRDRSSAPELELLNHHLAVTSDNAMDRAVYAARIFVAWRVLRINDNERRIKQMSDDRFLHATDIENSF